MASCELAHVAVQMLRADVVEGSHDAPVEQGPKALDAVRVGHASDVFTRAVLDRHVSP